MGQLAPRSTGRDRNSTSAASVTRALKQLAIRQAYGGQHALRNRVDADRSSNDSRRAPAIAVESDRRTIAGEFQGGHGRGPGESNDTVIALLALDGATNAVLPIGYLSHDSPRSDEWNRIVSEGAQFAGGLRLPEDKFTFIDGAPPKFSRPVLNAPTLSIDRGAATIDWDLDPATFSNAVDRQAGSIPVMASLPETLRVVLLSEAARLPFQGTNLAAARECSPWSSDANAKPVRPSRFSASTITLVPNASANNPVRYRLREAFLQSLRNALQPPV